MLINKEVIIKDLKQGLVVVVIYTILMFLSLLIPFIGLGSNPSKGAFINFIIFEMFIFIAFTFPFGIIFGLRHIIDTLIKINKIKKGEFVIVEDTITGVYSSKIDDDSSKVGTISLKKYVSERLYINFVKFRTVKRGNKCVLIFTDITKRPNLCYTGNDLEIDVSLQDKIVNVDRIYKTKRKNRNKFVANKEPILLDKKQLLNDCINKSQINTAIIFALLIFLFSFLFFVVLLTFGAVSIIVGLVVVFLVVWECLKIDYLHKIKKSIKNNKFRLVRDIVSQKGFSKIYDSEYLKFEKYKKNWYYMPDELLFADAEVGDIFYMLYIPNESEPIYIYIEKNVILSEEIKKYIK